MRVATGRLLEPIGPVEHAPADRLELVVGQVIGVR